MKIQIGEEGWSLFYKGYSPIVNYPESPNLWVYTGPLDSHWQGIVKRNVLYSEVITSLLGK